MNRAYRSAFFFTVAIFLAGCGSSNRLGTIGSETVTLSEFEKMYAKNNGGWEKAASSTLEQRKAFLDLFVKYKLKLREAEARGLLQDSAVQDELATYRASVASTYMINKEIIEPKLTLLYERRNEELRASHILIRLNQDVSPEDTLAAYNQTADLIRRARTASFDSLARAFSQDPSVSTNGGNLGWFSQGRMVRQFEDAVFSLQPGEISPVPVRTQFGYHVIKLTGRQPNQGSVHVSHILKRFSPAMDDTAAVRDSVHALYESIRNGFISFEAAAVAYSDDPAGKSRQGDLGLYDRSRLPDEVADLFFSTPVGSVAAPFEAPYGYHIFKINAVRPVPPFEQLEKEIRQYYQQQYYASDYEQYVHALKTNYNLDFDVKLRHEFTHSFDSTKSPAYNDWADTIKPDLYAKTLCTFGGKTFTVGQIIAHIDNSDEFKTQLLTSANVDEIIDRIIDANLLEHHATMTGDRHPTFTELMKEYENGVLIYRLDHDEIWQKVTPVDSLLRIYYEENKEKYRWPARINLAEIHVNSDSAALAIYDRILAGADFGELAGEFTVRPGFKEKKGEWGLLPFRANELTARAVSMEADSVSPPFKFENGWSMVKVLAKDPARTKTFEEALPEVTSHYQDSASKTREREWIEALKKRYGVDLDEEKLSDAFKSPPAS